MAGKVLDEKEWSPNTQPMLGCKSPGLHDQTDFCNRVWRYVASGACCGWQRGTHVDGGVMEATTSTTHSHQPQATPLKVPAHITPLNTHKHACMADESGRPHCVYRHTIHIHPNYMLHHQLCAGQHPHPTPYSCNLIRISLGKRRTTWRTRSALKTYCSVCHVMPLPCNHSFQRQLPSHCVLLSHTLCLCYSGKNEVWERGTH